MSHISSSSPKNKIPAFYLPSDRSILKRSWPALWIVLWPKTWTNFFLLLVPVPVPSGTFLGNVPELFLVVSFMTKDQFKKKSKNRLRIRQHTPVPPADTSLKNNSKAYLDHRFRNISSWMNASQRSLWQIRHFMHLSKYRIYKQPTINACSSSPKRSPGLQWLHKKRISMTCKQIIFLCLPFTRMITTSTVYKVEFLTIKWCDELVLSRTSNNKDALKWRRYPDIK